VSADRPADQTTLPATLIRDIERSCDRFEAAWKAGPRPRIEMFLGDAHTSARPELLRELLVVELGYRTRAGELPTPDEYRPRFPEHGALLAAVFERYTPPPLPKPATPPQADRERDGADRNLLFGILALQMDFVTRDSLIAAMNAWVLEKARPLGEILVAHGALDPRDRALLEPMIVRHIQVHGDNPAQSLSVVNAIPSTRDELRSIADDDVQLSLGHLGAMSTETTRATAHVGAPTSPGGRFRIIRLQAKGGLGEVFVARDEELHREVALKQIQSEYADSAESRSRFVVEAEITGGLEHPGIVPVYGLGHYDDGRPYYAMRFIKGESLKEAIKAFHEAEGPHRNSATGSLELRQLLRRFLDVCNAVAYAHSRGVLHRDLKPGNVMLGSYGETLVVDWGLAKVIGRPDSALGEETLRPSSGSAVAATQAGKALGTWAYMSPEQARGELDRLGPTSDVYSLGATLYHLLTGQAPFAGVTEAEIQARVIAGEFVPPCQAHSAVPAALDAVCRKAMAREPGARYDSPRALADDIEHWLADEPVSALPESWSRRLARWGRWHRARVQVAVAAMALITLISVVAVVAIDQARGQAEARRRDADIQRVLAERRLFEARLAQVRAGRGSGRAGRRFEGLAILAETSALVRDRQLGPEAVLVLRNEAIACTILPDLRLDREWEGSPPQSGIPIGIAFDAAMERYARVEADGTVTVRALADNAVLVHITDLGAPNLRAVDWRVFLRFSPDGRYLATRSQPFSKVHLQVWDLSGPRRLLSVPGCGEWWFQDFDFSPDGRILATGQADGSIGLYEVRSARLLNSIAPRSSPTGLRFDPTGQKLAVSRDGDRAVKILDLTGRTLGAPLSHPEPVTAAPTWHPDGELLACGCSNGLVLVWDTRAGKSVAVCKGQGHVIAVDFSHGGDLLASSSWDGTTRLWDPRTGQPLVSTDGRVVGFSRDDRWLGRELEGPYVGRLEVATGRECRTLRGAGVRGLIHALDFDSDGRWLAAAAEDGVHLWDLRTDREVQVIALGRTESVTFDETGKFLTTCGSAGLYRWPMRWDAGTSGGCLHLGPAQALDLPIGFHPSRCTQSRDGQRLAVDSGPDVAILLDLSKPHRRPPGVRDESLCYATISPDGRWTATGTWNGYTCRVWDARTGFRVLEYPARSARPAFSPDSRWLVIGTSREHALHQLEGGRWRYCRSLPREQGRSTLGLSAFARDAQTVALTYSSRSIQFLDTRRWRELATVSAPDSEELTALSFSPDGSRLAAGTRDGAVQIWDLHEIRAPLRELGLDWEPPAPPPRFEADAGPVRVEVDRGELTELARASLLLALWPFNAEAYYRRGRAHARLNELQEALADYLYALALKPNHAGAEYQRGLVLDRLRRVPEAIDAWSRAIALDPDHADAYAARADAYERLHRWDEAIEDELKVVALRPDWSEFSNTGAWLLTNHPDPRRRNPGRAIALALKALEQEPDNAAYWNTLGVARYRAGDWRLAAEALERSIALLGYIGSHDGFFLAMSRWQLGERQEAIRLYREATQGMEKSLADDGELRRFRAEAEELLQIESSASGDTDRR
jgi:WD40 repeat protein/tetratricopeptide (TPR) repeat protein/tRNA A-37 threonylcarbamoyl transferase component Bud32